jgi:hypothetical protein
LGLFLAVKFRQISPTANSYNTKETRKFIRLQSLSEMDSENTVPVENVFAFATKSQETSNSMKGTSEVIENTLFSPQKQSNNRPVTASKLTPKREPLSQQKTQVKSASKLVASMMTTSTINKTPFSPSNLSTFSIESSSTRESARKAKEVNTKLRIEKVQQLKEKWAKDKERKANFYQERRQQTIQRLEEETQKAAETRKRQLERQRQFQEQQKLKEKESLALSLQASRELVKDLEKETKARRRISIFLNSQIRKKQVEKERILLQEKKQYEESLLESKRVDALQIREKKTEGENRRRESLMNRTLYAQELKKRSEELDQQQKEHEKSLLNSRKQNFEDTQRYKQQCKQEEIQDLQVTLANEKEWKMKEKQLIEAEMLNELQLLQSRHEDWKCVQAYKQELEHRKRESLQFRISKWKQEKSLEQEQKEQELLAKQLESELTKLAYQDVQQYRTQCDENRRQSLQYRLDKMKKDIDFEKGQVALRQMMEEEERRLQALDRQDIANYKQKILNARRESLEYRHQFEVCFQKIFLMIIFIYFLKFIASRTNASRRRTSS